MASRQVLVTGVNADGTPFSGYMTEVDFAPTDSQLSGQKWATCTRCGHVARQSEMKKRGAQFYCYYSNCAEEVN